MFCRDSSWLLAWNEFGSFHLASLHSAPGITLFSAVRWAQMVRLFPPWPLQKAPGGHCVSLWRVCPWSSPCCLTKLLSRYKPSLLHPHHLLCCACPKVALGNKCCVVNVLRADGKRMMLWKNSIFSWICCSRTEWVSYSFRFVFVHLHQKSLRSETCKHQNKIPCHKRLRTPDTMRSCVFTVNPGSVSS